MIIGNQPTHLQSFRNFFEITFDLILSRTREDTVRCIVSSLTDDSNKELAEELIKAEPVTMDESYCSEQEDEDHHEWQPDPIDADPGKRDPTPQPRMAARSYRC